MQFTIDTSVTIDVALRQPLALYRAARNGDQEALKDAVTVLDFDYDISRGD